MISFADGLHADAALDHSPDGFVSEHAAGSNFRNVALQDVKIRPADRDRVDANDHITVLQDLGVRHLIEALLSGTVIDDCAHNTLLERLPKCLPREQCRLVAMGPCSLGP